MEPKPPMSVISLKNGPKVVEETNQQKHTTDKTLIGKYISIRYVILVLTILCLSSIMANIICFNFTVLCMPNIHEQLPVNHTEYSGFNPTERTMLFSSVAIGALLAVIPFSHLIATVGCRRMFVLAGFMSTVATALTPLAASTHLYFFLLLRFIQGISFSACMPTVGSVTASWASLTQNGLFIAVLTTFGQLSAVFSMPIAGELCESTFGWQSIFYVHSAFSAFVFALWFIAFRDEPEEHSWISKKEMNEITLGKHHHALHEHEKVPYLAIVTTPSIWGVWVGALGDLIAVQVLHTFSPLYIRTVLKYSVHNTGFAAALPVLCQFVVKVFAGHSSDRIHGISETTKLRIYNSFALGLSAVFMAALAFVEEGQSILGIVLITVTTSLFGFNGGGFNKCASLVSRQFSPFVFANIQFIWCLSMLLCPLVVAELLPTGSHSEWQLVFFVHAAILVLANAFFCLVATAKPAPWTDENIKTTALKNRPFFT